MTKNTRTPEEIALRAAETRRLRLHGRQALRLITTDLPRCYDCGREPIGDAVGVRRTADGVVGFAGLASCGRVWLCPVCNAKVMAKRAIEIGLAVAWAQTQDIHLVWGSLTVRHNSSSDLGQLLELQRSAWRRVVSSKWWRSNSATTTAPHAHTRACAQPCDRKQDPVLLPIPGRVGYIRAAELTIGSNGWHPHFHPLVMYRGTAQSARRFADRLVSEWVHAVEHFGGEARIEGGQQLEVLPRDAVAFSAVGEYVTKQTYDHSALALELVWSQNKVGSRSKGRAAKTVPHWALLVSIAEGDGTQIEEVTRWHELEAAVPGHRMISWSRGLRQFAGVGDEATDEEVAAEEVGTKDDTVCFITPQGWADLRDQPEEISMILTTLERGGWVALRVLLDHLGVEFFTLELAG